ncbi:uncharacterized protein [Engystomops pustulosus]|uniref:uncharacterized protein n=1 Tax=Engystomops pustulosus TaxID=76066 RepID=UPI003AFA42A6
MKLCSSCLEIAILLLGCSVTVLCQRTVTGIEGQPITLPCSYRVRRTSDITSMCWGRGSCPNSKCTQELIWTDGYKVTFQASSRYELKERLRQGIVSLTIAQVRLEDAGTYCCRIEHHGWFNDEKINVQLRVERAPTTTVQTTTPAPTTVKTTPAPLPVETTPEPTYPWTISPTTPVEVTTQPPPSVTTSPPPLPPITRTDAPPSSTARSMTSPSNDLHFESTVLTPRSSDIPIFIPEHEETTSAESETEDREHNSPSPWPENLVPDDNGISDLFQGNVTAPQKKDKSSIIIAISLSLIALIVICIILLQLKGQKRGRYLLGLDPRLELVTHAEESVTEVQAEDKDPKRDEETKAGINHIGNMIDATD